MNKLLCSVNSFTICCTLLLLFLFPYSAQYTGSIAHSQKRLTSVLNNKVDMAVSLNIDTPGLDF